MWEYNKNWKKEYLDDKIMEGSKIAFVVGIIILVFVILISTGLVIL
jgi:hypothetical protein